MAARTAWNPSRTSAMARGIVTYDPLLHPHPTAKMSYEPDGLIEEHQDDIRAAWQDHFGS